MSTNRRPVKGDLFTTGRFQHFRKGDLYRDPRINRNEGQKDFLMIDAVEEDYEFLEKYLKGELANYPSEDYNMFTTGVDKNGASLVGLYWVDAMMENHKKALILCKSGAEERVLDIVDRCCKEEGEVRAWEQRKVDPIKTVVKPSVVQHVPNGGSSMALPPTLAKYKKN